MHRLKVICIVRLLDCAHQVREAARLQNLFTARQSLLFRKQSQVEEGAESELDGTLGCALQTLVDAREYVVGET